MRKDIELESDFVAQLSNDVTYYPTSPTTAYDKVLDQRSNWVGIHEWHLADGKRCGGFVTFDTPEAREVTTPQAPKWTVESWAPLTLSPSLLCRICGHHGFIRQDRWESC